MRAFAKFVALLSGAILIGALLAYPAYSLTQALGADWPLHRVANRLALLLVLIGLVWLLRHLQLANRAGLGYALGRREFIFLLLRTLAVGVLSMLPVIAFLLLTDVRVLRTGITFQDVLTLAAKGLLSGLVVAFTEETFFRGAMHSAIRRESGVRLAIALTALLYSALHFLGRARVPRESVEWSSGLDLLAQTFGAYAEPSRMLDSFLALFAVGILLGLIRERFGNVAACIGLHAGWVWTIAVTRELTTRNTDSPWSFLVGSYDGVIGYLVLAWTAVLTVVFWRIGPARAAPTSLRA